MEQQSRTEKNKTNTPNKSRLHKKEQFQKKFAKSIDHTNKLTL